MNWRAATIVGLLLFGFGVLGSGWVDLDWMIVSYRYSEWHRSQQTWEFCPWFRMEWWSAYMLTFARVVAGSALVSACLTWFYLKLSGLSLEEDKQTKKV